MTNGVEVQTFEGDGDDSNEGATANALCTVDDLFFSFIEDYQYTSLYFQGRSEAVARCPRRSESFAVAISIALVGLRIPASQGNIPFTTSISNFPGNLCSIMAVNRSNGQSILAQGISTGGPKPFRQLPIDPAA